MHIIRPHREIVLDRVLPLRIEGYVTCTLIDAQTKKVVKEFKFKNTFTNAGLNILGTRSVVDGSGGASVFNDAGLLSSCLFLTVGTGTTPPNVTDTTLEGEIGGARTRDSAANAGTTTPDMDEGYVAGPPTYNWGRRCIRFGAGVANGVIGKVGFFTASSGPTLLCQARVKDGSGTPTTFTKTSAFLLDVTWEVRIYPPDDSVQTISINGVSTDITAKVIGRRTTDAWWASSAAAGVVGNKSSHMNFIPSAADITVWSRVSGNGNALVSSIYYTDKTPTESGGTIGTYATDSFHQDYTLVIGPGTGRLIEVMYLSRNITGGFTNPPFGFSFNPIYTLPSTNRFTFVARYAWGRYP